MPLSWDDKHPNILRMHIPNIRNWGEYDALVDESIVAINRVDTRVDVIVTRDVVRYRNGGLSHFKRGIEAVLALPNFGCSVSIASENSEFAEALMTSIVRSIGDEADGRFIFMPTLEDAYAYILADRIKANGDATE